MNRAGPSTRASTATKRTASTAGVDKELRGASSKKPALSSVFSNHISQSSLNRQLLNAQAKVSELQNTLTEKQAVIDRLESDRTWLSDREEEERKAKEKEVEERAQERSKYEREISDLRRRLSNLENEYHDLRDSHSQLSQETQTELTQLRADLVEQEGHSKALLGELEVAKQSLLEIEDDKRQLQERLESLQDGGEVGEEDIEEDQPDDTDSVVRASEDDEKSSTSSRQPSPRRRRSIKPRISDTNEDWKLIEAELHRQMEYVQTLEASNARLKGEVEQLREKADALDVVNEERADLQRKLSNMDELRRKLGEVENQLAIERQGNAASSSRAVPVAVTQEINSLRSAHALLLDESGQLKADLRAKEKAIAELQSAHDALLEEADGAKAALQANQELLATKARDSNLMEKEITFLKSLISSYSTEESSNTELPEGSEHAKEVERYEQYVGELESLVEEYKATIKSLEEDIARGGAPLSSRKQEQFTALTKELEDLRAEKVRLESACKEVEATAGAQAERVEELEQELFELGGKIGAGNHIPPGVRVLSLRENPLQQWADTRQAILDRLKSENQALLNRLKELEESGAQVKAEADESMGNAEGDDAKFVPRQSWDVIHKEKEELEEAVKQKEKRLLRLQQVFTAKSAEFRDAIASILGLKLAFYPNGQVRVTSQYDLSASFVFQPSGPKGDGMKMQLVAQGEGGPPELPQLMQYWVEQEMCIPGLIASVTLECYEKSKQEQRHGQQG